MGVGNADYVASHIAECNVYLEGDTKLRHLQPVHCKSGTSAPGVLGTKWPRYMTPKSPVRRCKSPGRPPGTLDWGQG